MTFIICSTTLLYARDFNFLNNKLMIGSTALAVWIVKELHYARQHVPAEEVDEDKDIVTVECSQKVTGFNTCDRAFM